MRGKEPWRVGLFLIGRVRQQAEPTQKERARQVEREREREKIFAQQIIGLIIFILAKENDKVPLRRAVIMNRMSERWKDEESGEKEDEGEGDGRREEGEEEKYVCCWFNRIIVRAPEDYC